MKHRLSFIAAVASIAVLSAIVMAAPAARANSGSTVDVRRVRPAQGMPMLSGDATTATLDRSDVVAVRTRRPQTAVES